MIKTKSINALQHLINNSLPNDANIEDWVKPSDSDEGYAEEVLVRYEEKIYKSMAANNKDVPTSALKWSYQRPSNQTAWADSFPTTASESDSDIVLEFDHVFDYSVLVFSNMVGTELKIEITRQDGTSVYDKTITLNDYEEPTTWDSYYLDFGDVHQKTEHIENINSFEVDVNIKITLTTRGGKAKLGLFHIATYINMGCTSADVTIDRSPSAKIIEERGVKRVIGGSSSWRKTSYTLHYTKGQIFYEELKKMDKENTKSGVFIGDDTGDELEYMCVGFYDGYTANPQNKSISIDVYSIDTY